MIVKTYLNVGDKVYFLAENNVQVGTISAIYSTVYALSREEEKTEIKVKVKGHILPDNKVFKTKQELCENTTIIE